MSILTYINEALEDNKKEEGLSVLDKALNGDNEEIKELINNLSPQLYYIYEYKILQVFLCYKTRRILCVNI